MMEMLKCNIGLGAWIIGEATLQNIDMSVDILVGITALLINAHVIGNAISKRKRKNAERLHEQNSDQRK